MPEISIVVPVFQTEAYLNQCVESILCQTFTDFELILVDDGSTDNSPKLCDSWHQKDPRVKVIHQPNAGPAIARNVGMIAAKGNYFCFVDSDDWIQNDMIEQLYNCAVAENADIVQSGLYLYSKTSCVAKPLETPILGTFEIYEKVLPDFFGKVDQASGVLPNLCGKIFRRELLMSNINCCPECIRNGEDSLLLTAALCACHRFVTLSVYCGYYYNYCNPDSLTHQYTKQYRENIPHYYNALRDIAHRYNYLDIAVIDQAEQCAYAAAIPFVLVSSMSVCQKVTELRLLRHGIKDSRSFHIAQKKHAMLTRWAMTLVYFGFTLVPSLLFSFIHKNPKKEVLS